VANILTAAEAANVLRCDATDAAMLQLLPLVDSYLRDATGHDWTADATIHATAKAAAQMLIVMWYENPGMLGQGISPLNFGLTAALTQLEAIALQYKSFPGRTGAGPCTQIGVRVGDTVISLIGLIGATGDQHTAFETVITVDDEIQQISTSNLSANWYRARLVSPESL